jgi:electron transport complex protein RnfA
MVIASLVQLVEIFLKKMVPPLYEALGIYLPLITTNCAILGVALLVVEQGYNFVESVVYAISTAIGFTLVITIFSAIREQLEVSDVPPTVKGVSIALITAGLLSMAFMGFAGLGG